MPWVSKGETVTLLRATSSGERDALGVVIPGLPMEIPLEHCVVAPRMERAVLSAGGADQQARDTTILGWTVYAPPGSDVLTTDRVVIRGVTCEITGEAGDFGTSPWTDTRGPVQFAARRVMG
jgi:hypothetical protein